MMDCAGKEENNDFGQAVSIIQHSYLVFNLAGFCHYGLTIEG